MNYKKKKKESNARVLWPVPIRRATRTGRRRRSGRRWRRSRASRGWLAPRLSCRPRRPSVRPTTDRQPPASNVADPNYFGPPVSLTCDRLNIDFDRTARLPTRTPSVWSHSFCVAVKGNTYVDRALAGVPGIQVVVGVDEVAGAVDAAGRGDRHGPIERRWVPAGQRHRPATEEVEQVRQRFQAHRIDGVCCEK